MHLAQGILLATGVALALALASARDPAALAAQGQRDQPRAVTGDPRAEALMARCHDAIHRTRTLKADVETAIEVRGQRPRKITGTAILQRPNRMRIELKGNQLDLMVSDGATFYLYWTAVKKYMKRPPGRDGRGISTLMVIAPVDLFWVDANIGSGGGSRYAGREKIEGETFEVVETRGGIRYYFSLGNHLLCRVTMSQAYTRITSALKNVRTEMALDPGLFRWTPPKGAELIDWWPTAGQ